MGKKSNDRPPFLLAVDPSLTASGWAMFRLNDGLLTAVGLIEPPGPKEFLASRFNALQQHVRDLFEKLELEAGDFMVCEGPAPLVRNPQSAIKVEGVRGIFESVARSHGVSVPGRINPRTVQSEILGMKGRQLARATVKEWSRAAAVRLYERELRQFFNCPAGVFSEISQDIIDAMLIGTVAVSRVQVAVRTKSTVESVFVSSGSRRKLGGASRTTGWTEAEFKRRFSN